MSKNDINSLGSLYGGMLNGLKKDLIKEGKVGPGEIGDAALQTGGPTKEGGFAEAEVDIEKLTDKEKEDNLYNINNLSYTNSYMLKRMRKVSMMTKMVRKRNATMLTVKKTKKMMLKKMKREVMVPMTVNVKSVVV